MIGAMTDTLQLRGPDDSGTWHAPHVALGHTRLAIIDLATGSQPMVFTGKHGKPVALVFSGEIYNYRELRDELRRRGRAFRTTSDTEVLWHAYDEWGAGCVEHLNGMFAFAVWDGHAQELLLVRDRLGIKPLFYFRTPHGVVFGSELKAVLAHPEVPAEVDEQGLNELFAMAPMTTPGTAVFKDMIEVRPGWLVRVNRSGVREHRYWQLESRPHTDDLPATVAYIRELFDDIIARQSVADRPVAALLSGGVDSSATAAALAKVFAASGEPLPTFSIDYKLEDGVRYSSSSLHLDSDAPFAEMVAKHIGSDHTAWQVSTDDLVGAQQESRRAMDLPSLPHVNVSLLLLFRRIAEYGPVAISGEVADEIFRGYRWHRDPDHYAHAGFPWASTYPPAMGLLARGVRRQLDPERYLRDRYLAALDDVPHLAGETGDDRRRREVTHLTITHYLRFLLARKDRASMAAGVEARVPFGDHRLVEYAWNIPNEILTAGGMEKGVLRMAIGDLLPREVAWRPKSGYPVAQTRRYQKVLWGRLRDVLAEPDAPLLTLVDHDRVHALLDGSAGDLSTWDSFLHVSYLLDVNDWLTEYNVRIR
ncbi:asparagine synthase (glutamine-hydrolyzing) [Allocatelliglobosispora scoriae]|uniref:asparagine synthase (glutamine-hydrolyzing) n=1 Tax=Allocatelliglobosispora scoriae TaxID=643052 RepID=A0A841BYE8_9ACTN|nr:asparagine synthase (glutamine-hydrolyzing) [Allocatelliglobosispora scoriae]